MLMNLRIYCIVEEGADRVYVQTGYPHWYKKPAGKRAMIVAVDTKVPDYDSPDVAVSGQHSATWEAL